MADRITKGQFLAACDWATNSGRAIGVVKEGQRVATVTAWTMDYVVILEIETGRIVQQLTECDNMRGLYNRLRAIDSAWRWVARAVSPSELRAAVN